MRIAVYHHLVVPSTASEESILAALRQEGVRIMSKLDELGATEDQEIALTEQLLTQARASAANIADLQQQLAAALNNQPNLDPQIQAILDKATAEVGNLTSFLSPSPVPEPPVPGA